MLIPYHDSSQIIRYRMANENAFRGFVRCPNCSFTVTRFGDVPFRECNKCNTTFQDNCKTLCSLDDVEKIFSNLTSDFEESSRGKSSLHGSENSSVTRHTTKSLDFADHENFTNQASDIMGSSTQGSSHGTPLLHGSKKIVSKRTRRPSGFINTEVEKVEACSVYSEMSACSQEQLQERTIASRSSSRNSSLCAFEHEMSVDYVDVLSEYNSVQSEMDASFRSALSRSTPGDIPTVTPSTERTLISTNKEAEPNSIFVNSEPEKDIFHSHSTIPCYPNEVPWRSRRTLAKDSQHLKPIFPAETDYCCLHCKAESCQSSVPYSQGICCSNGMCKTCRHSCCRTSTDAKCHSASKPLHHHINHNHHDKEKLDLQQKQESSKRCYKPVLGGINFMMCYKCFFALQMPLPFQFSTKKTNKLRCGKCQQVLLYSVIDGTHIVPREYSPGENYSTGKGAHKKPQGALHRMMGYFSARDIIYEPYSKDTTY